VNYAQAQESNAELGNWVGIELTKPAKSSCCFAGIGNLDCEPLCSCCLVLCGLGVRVSPHRALGAPLPRRTWRRPRYAQKNLVWACASSPEISWGGHGILPTVCAEHSVQMRTPREDRGDKKYARPTTAHGTGGWATCTEFGFGNGPFLGDLGAVLGVVLGVVLGSPPAGGRESELKPRTTGGRRAAKQGRKARR
jgi:hypothetical protein